MRPSLRAAIVVVAACCPAIAQSEPPSPALDLRATLELVRQQAPSLQAGRLRIDEAAGLLSEAELPFASDPRLDMSVGNRDPEDGSSNSHDWSFGISQRFEPSGARDARRDVARVDVDAARSAAGEAELLALARAAELYLRAVHAGARRAAFAEDGELARQVLAAVRQRVQAGGSSELDAHLAVLNAGRAAGDAAAAAGDEGRLLAELGTVLGVQAGERVSVTGPLAWPWPVDEDEALAAAARRPGLRRLEAEAQRAEAEERVAESAGRSDLDAHLDYGRDDRDRVLTLGISIGLPLSGRGAGERAAAAAHASRSRGELAAGLRAAENDVRAAVAVHAGLAAAAAEAGDVAQELDESTRLVVQRWQAGGLDLLDVLALRRELLATRLAWLDRQLDLALAALEVETLSGQLAEIAP